jgi:cytochrome c biogenesis protein CcmG/thiol:disulfide interchange protein DsbE
MSTESKSGPVHRRASRLPYALATLGLGAFVVMAWLGQHRLEPVIAGRPAPEFSATNLRGEPVRLSDYRNKVVLVNVWATWCAPCRVEMPSMERLYQEVRSRPGGDDFEILAVSVDASLERPEPGRGGVALADLGSFADELGLTFPIVHDARGRIQNLYQTTGVPESFLIGRDGIIYRKVAGETEWDAPLHLDLIRSLLER